MSKVRKHRDNGHERRDHGKAVEIYALHHAIHHITIYPRAKRAIHMPNVRNHMEANMRELQMTVQTLLVVGVIAGGWLRFMEMIFDISRTIAKRIDRKEVVLTTKEIEEITADMASPKLTQKEAEAHIIGNIMQKRRIQWRAISYDRANHKLYFWQNYSL